ncbi:MAG: heavy metal translocating P-type ATPase, partial [Spirochaetota bacterium]
MAITGGVYLAKKIYNKRQNKKKLTEPNIQGTTTQTIQPALSQNHHETQINNRNIALSVVLMFLSAGGYMGFLVLKWFSVPLLIYLQLPIFKLGHNELFKKRKVGAAVRDSLLSITMVSLGYFFAPALFFIQYYISRNLLLKTEDSSEKNLIDIWAETSQSVWIEQDDIEVEIALNKLQIGNVVVVNAGETIPVDGIVEKGMGNVDQHILTGESQLVEKMVGDTIFASTVLLSGRLYIKVSKTGSETVVSQIKSILNNTTDYKSSQQARGEKLADKYALPSIIGGIITLPILGIHSAATMLLVSFGGQMRILAPISVLNFLKIASDNNVLIKDGRALESLHNIDTVVFDKTGTLTQEQPYVKAIHTCHAPTKDEVLLYAAAAEYKQKHPIALAILQEAQNRNLQLPIIDEANYEIGYGVKVRLNDKMILVGSLRFMTMENIPIPPEVSKLQKILQDQSSSLVYVAVNKQLIGTIELQATIREEAKQVIDNLHQRGMKTIIISGDNEKPTQKLARELGIDQYFAETLPNNKAKLVEQLQNEGKSVCFVGDGINDSIALKKANVSISLRGALIRDDQHILPSLGFIIQTSAESKSSRMSVY